MMTSLTCFECGKDFDVSNDYLNLSNVRCPHCKMENKPKEAKSRFMKRNNTLIKERITKQVDQMIEQANIRGRRWRRNNDV